MKRIVPAAILIVALVVAFVGITKPWIGDVTETWQAGNGSIKVRVENRAENLAWLPGAYYVFQTMPPGSNRWREIMTFRHDDPGPIPRGNARLVGDKVGYLFMGWMYAVTTDGGVTWSVWNAEKDLPNWDCCNYGLIKDVNIESDGTGKMILSPISGRRGEVPELRTNDFGRHWVP